MSVSAGHATHIGPPVSVGGGGGIPDFNATTKVVAYTTANQAIPAFPSFATLSFANVLLDTKGEFDSASPFTTFRPSENGWYGIGGSLLFLGLTLAQDGQYVVQISTGSSIIFDVAPLSGPIPGRITGVQFYFPFELSTSDTVFFRASALPVSATFYGVPGSLASRIFFNKIL